MDWPKTEIAVVLSLVLYKYRLAYPSLFVVFCSPCNPCFLNPLQRGYEL
jgi:hypothetical protein